MTDGPEQGPAGPVPPLGPRGRLVRALAAWLLLFLGSPGVLSADGEVALTLVGFAVWTATARRPGPAGARIAPFWTEGLAGGLGWAGLMGWAALVWPPLLLWIAAGHGIYVGLTGVLLRRLHPRVPLALAAPLAWIGVETVRGLLPPPFGLEAYQLGHALHAWPALAGSARVWGVGGVGFALAAFAGFLATLGIGGAAGVRVRDVALGIGPALLAWVLALVVPAPETRPGPTVLLVQPAFEQRRKQYGDRFDNHREAAALTMEAIEALRAEGRELPDLVCWGETMVATTIFEEEVLRALAGGWEPPEWQERWLTVAWIRRERAAEEALVRRELLERLPPGTSFLSGVEVFQWVGGEARRGNAVVLWDAEGRSGPALKRYTVPGAESMLGLERFALVRDAVMEIAGYVPNLSAGERTRVLELSGREGETWRFGATICFDNAFVAPYTEPLREASGSGLPFDFHLVVSNEAWYGETWEAHQMIAYSRLVAMATGRSLVRATNSGVSAVLAPDGSDVRLRGPRGGERMVRGTLAARVPVPAAPDAEPTPFTRSDGYWRALWLAAAAVLVLRGRRRENR